MSQINLVHPKDDLTGFSQLAGLVTAGALSDHKSLPYC
jgi:hypothetical protein